MHVVVLHKLTNHAISTHAHAKNYALGSGITNAGVGCGSGACIDDFRAGHRPRGGNGDRSAWQRCRRRISHKLFRGNRR